MGESKGNSATKYKNQNPASAYRILKRRLRILFVLAIILLSFAFTESVEAKSIEVSVESGIDDLAFSRINGYDLVEVSGKKCSLHGKPGEPLRLLLKPKPGPFIKAYGKLDEPDGFSVCDHLACEHVRACHAFFGLQHA